MSNEEAIQWSVRRSITGLENGHSVWHHRVRDARREKGLPYKNQDQVAAAVQWITGWPGSHNLNGIKVIELDYTGLTTQQRLDAYDGVLKQELDLLPDKPTRGPGSRLKLEDQRGRMIGYGPLWFPGSRIMWATDDEVRDHLKHPHQRQCNTVWGSLSTWMRPEMNESIRHALSAVDRMLERFELLDELGWQVCCEAATLEYITGHKHNNGDHGHLKGDPKRIYDYLEAVGERIIRRAPNVNVAFPYREMNLVRRTSKGTLKKLSVPDRMRLYNQSLKALARGIGSGSTRVGMHTGTAKRGSENAGGWVPPHAMLQGVDNLWLAQTGFDHGAQDKFEWEDDNHRVRKTNTREHLDYWGANRFRKNIIMSEMCINDKYAPKQGGWGPAHSVDEALSRGREVLKSEHVICDLSGGAAK